MKKLLSVKNVVISIAVLILIWQLLFMISSFDAALFPSPKMAFDALIEMIQNGKLFENIGTRPAWVATFLALLEMMKLEIVYVDTSGEEIMITKLRDGEITNEF